MRAALLCAALLLAAPFAEARAQDRGYTQDGGVIDDRPAHEGAVPKNQGWVTDLAGMLSASQRHELEALMESYKQGTTHEIALLTVPNLGGQPIERFALDVGRAWGMGTAQKNNAALLVVSKADRKIRIEVARGLEGSLTDSMCGRIIREVIVPQFKRGDFPAGLKDGVLAIHAAIGGNYAQAPARGNSSAGAIVAGLVPLLVILIIIFVILARIGSRVSRGRGFFLGPWIGGGGGFGGRGFGGFGGGGGGGGFSGFGGGGGFSGGGASGGW